MKRPIKEFPKLSPEKLDDKKSVKLTLYLILFIVVWSLLLIAIIVGTQNKLISSASSATNNFVSFDTSKYLNARRSHTSKLLDMSLSTEELENVKSVIFRADKIAREVIEEYANGRVVLVTQSLALNNQIEDITNDVLINLGLSIDAPSYQTKVDEIDYLGTSFDQGESYKSFINAYREREKKSMEVLRKNDEHNKANDLQQWLP